MSQPVNASTSPQDKHPFLRQIILVGHDGRPRILEFDTGVNIVSGTGSKGKSALLKIVQYCLGGPFRIPGGKVRLFCAWYFLRLTVNQTEVLIGRQSTADPRNPSSNAYFSKGPNAELPTHIESNATISRACEYLGQLLRLPKSVFVMGEESQIHGNITTTHLLPLLLQPQELIASPQLFLPTESRDESKIRAEVFKLALGIIHPSLIAMRATQDSLQKKIKVTRGKIRELESQNKKALGRLEHLRQQAWDTDGKEPPSPLSSLDQMRIELEKMRMSSAEKIANLSSTSWRNAKISTLDAKSQEIRRSIRQISSELTQIARLRAGSDGVKESLDTQSARLRVVDVLAPRLSESPQCPLCTGPIGTEEEELLARMQSALEEELLFVKNIPPELDVAEGLLRSHLNELKQSLSEIETELQSLQKQEPAESITEEQIQKERLIGAIDATLSMQPVVDTNALQTKLLRLQREFTDLKEKLSMSQVEKDEITVQQELSAKMKTLANSLKRMNLLSATLRFDRSYSTLERVTEATEPSESLETLGGAESYVMYHLCAMLSLHQQFLSRPDNFVPPLLMLDQPSQVYFPVEADTQKTDINAVRDIYDLLFRSVAATNDRLQIIVVDHADFSKDNQTFFKAKKYDWHDEDGLI